MDYACRCYRCTLSDPGSPPASPPFAPMRIGATGGTATLIDYTSSLFCTKGVPRSLGEVGLMFYVYILHLRDNTYYLGFSSDLKTRIKTHMDGSVPQTRNLRPLQLICSCAFISKKRALDFEKYLKTGSGFAFRNKHLI